MPLTYKKLRSIINEFEYELVAQKWSHQKFRLWTDTIEIPKHTEIAVGTARSICKDIAKQQWIDFQKFIQQFELKF